MELATVCMVKNEESVIKRMIDSAAKVTDIFIFMDTGSTDSTKKIIKAACEEHGIPYEIHETGFKDFGITRTETVQAAIGKADYLLLLDADMTIEGTLDKEKLTKDGYHIYYTGANRYAQLLLVNGHLNWKYYGKTHEYIHTKEMKTIGEIHSLKINHHIDGSNRKDKFRRDIELLKKQIEENPQDRRAYFYLAESYRLLGEYKNAIEYYRQRIIMAGWKEEIYFSIYQMGRMFAEINELDQARVTLMDAWEFRPKRVESIHSLAVILRQTKKYNQAILFLEKALSTKFPKDDVLFVERPIYDYLLRFEYSISLFYVGRKKEALKQCNILLNENKMPDKFYNQTVKNKEIIEAEVEKEKQMKKKNPKYNKDIVFVSAFTKGTPYEEEIKRLRESLNIFGLNYIIYEIPNMGSWIRNTQEKPKYIFRALEEYQCPVVWLDADAEVLGEVDYFHYVKNDLQFFKIKQWDDFLTGTLFFNNNRRVKEFLSAWIYNCEIQERSSQKVFIDLVKKADYIDVGELPVEYVKIQDENLPEDYRQKLDNELQPCKKPKIIHHQASRRFKKEIQRIDFVKNYDNENKQDYDTVAVIGNGPFQSDLSDKIDQSYVIRCNNFKIGKEYKEIGSKTNMNASSLYNPIIPKYQVDYPIIGVHPIHDITGNYSDAKQMHHYWNNSKTQLLSNGNQVLTYNESDEFFDLWKNLADEIQGIPTVGLMAIALAKYWGFKKIILSGFNFFSTKKTHYWTDDPTTPSSHHKIKSEKELIRQWIDHDNIEYILDEETRRSLNDDKEVDVDNVMKTNKLYDGQNK